MNVSHYLDLTDPSNMDAQMFRGHASSSWHLLPSIARKKHFLSEHDLHEFKSWRDLEEFLLLAR